MKTRLLIVVGIILTTFVFGSYQYVMYECGTLPVFTQTPKMPDLGYCLQIWGNQPGGI